MAELTSSMDKFSYRPELIEPGTVYHYIKSNMDGSYPARIFIYIRDTVVIRYLGEEEHNETACRKYSIGGEGLRGHEGSMWVNREKGHIEDIEIPIADNPDWDNFKFKFISREQMDAQQWADFMDAEIRNLKAK